MDESKINFSEFVLLPKDARKGYERQELLVSLDKLSLEKARPALDKLLDMAPLALTMNVKNRSRHTSLYTEEEILESIPDLIEKRYCTLYQTLLNRSKSNNLNPNGYLGHLTVEEAVKMLGTMDCSLPSPRILLDFVRLLISGEAFDGKGKRIDKQKLSKSLDDILGKGGVKGEFTNTSYHIVPTCIEHQYMTRYIYNPKTGGLKIFEESRYNWSGDLTRSCIDRNPWRFSFRFSLNDWLNNSAPNGLPISGTKNGEMNFEHPQGFDGNFIFLANHTELGTGLFCVEGHKYKGTKEFGDEYVKIRPFVGVRPVIIKGTK